MWCVVVVDVCVWCQDPAKEESASIKKVSESELHTAEQELDSAAAAADSKSAPAAASASPAKSGASGSGSGSGGAASALSKPTVTPKRPVKLTSSHAKSLAVDLLDFESG